MSYDVDLSQLVMSKLQGWRLPARVQSEILERIYEELAESPTRHLKRLPPPAAIMEYSFCIVGEGEPSRDYLFSFTVL